MSPPETYSFGDWVSQRRKTLHLTQRELATAAACALATVKKIEADERRPSIDMALMLAQSLAIPADQQEIFVECARGQRPVDALARLTTSESLGDRALPRLPEPANALIGRKAEVVEVLARLTQADCRLLNLVGQGGIGKTRLALEAAKRLEEQPDSEVVFVPLTAITGEALIPNAIIHSLGLSLSNESQLLAYLKNQSLVLLLDNCEQLGDGVNWFSKLLNYCSNIKLLTTSRERLNLAEERIYQVPDLLRQQAVALFRQSASRSDVILDHDQDKEAIETICDLVGDLPLAIELAAGWLAIMPPTEIATRIQEDPDILAGNVRNAPERHQSMQAVFEHSWQLLPKMEQNALMHHSVFHGGFQADFAEAVAETNLSILRRLVERSMLHIDSDQRYHFHELTRQYAYKKLLASGENEPTKLQLLHTLNKLANELVNNILGPDAVIWYMNADRELDNIRAALDYAIEISMPQLGIQLLHKLFFYLRRRGHHQEAERWHRALLATEGEIEDLWRCVALTDLSTFTALQGRHAEARASMEQAASLAAELDDDYGRLVLYESQMQIISPDNVTAHFEKTEGLMQQWNDSSQQGRLGGLYGLYGDRLRDAGRTSEAHIFYEQQLKIFRTLGNVDVIAYPLGNLGRLAFEAGQLEEAFGRINESVSISRNIGNRVGIADWLRQLGRVLLAMGDKEQAGQVFEEAFALYEEIGNTISAADMLVLQGIAMSEETQHANKRDCYHDALIRYRKVFTPIVHGEQKWPVPLHSNNLGPCILQLAIFEEEQGDLEHTFSMLSAVESLQEKFSNGKSDVVFLDEAKRRSQAIQQLLPEATVERVRSSINAMTIEDFLNYILEEIL